jgi:hypothetical protein
MATAHKGRAELVSCNAIFPEIKPSAMNGSDLFVQRVASTCAAYADRIAAGGDSVLAELDPKEFEAGLKALRAHAAGVDPKTVTKPIDFFAFARMLV